MKSTNVALLALAGMLLTSVSVYSLTPPGGIKISASEDPDARLVPEIKPTESPSDPPVQAESSHFTAGSTLMVEGRVAHARVSQGSPGETFVMLEIRGSDKGM